MYVRGSLEMQDAKNRQTTTDATKFSPTQPVDEPSSCPSLRVIALEPLFL